MQLFIGIIMFKGVVEMCKPFDLERECEDWLLSGAKEHSREMGIEFDTYDELHDYMTTDDSIDAWEFIKMDTTKEDPDYDKYPIKVNGIYMTVEEFRKYLGKDHLFFDAGAEIPLSSRIEELDGSDDYTEFLYHLNYRCGEKEESIYALCEADALSDVCEDIHHPEFWDVGEDNYSHLLGRDKS